VDGEKGVRPSLRATVNIPGYRGESWASSLTGGSGPPLTLLQGVKLEGVGLRNSSLWGKECLFDQPKQNLQRTVTI